jgi:hypothetical protein
MEGKAEAAVGRADRREGKAEAAVGRAECRNLRYRFDSCCCLMPH